MDTFFWALVLFFRLESSVDASDNLSNSSMTERIQPITQKTEEEGKKKTEEEGKNPQPGDGRR